MDKVFTNHEEAKTYVLQRLTERYGKNFEILEQDDFRDKQFTQTYVCQFIDDVSERKYYARAIQNDIIEDDYAISYYAKRGDELWQSTILANTQFSLKYEGFHAPITSRCWNGEESFEEYCKNAKVYYKVVIEVKNQGERDEFIDDFMRFQEDCKKLLIPVECKIIVREKGDLWIKLGDEKKKSPYLSETELKEKMKFVF